LAIFSARLAACSIRSVSIVPRPGTVTEPEVSSLPSAPLTSAALPANSPTTEAVIALATIIATIAPTTVTAVKPMALSSGTFITGVAPR
jgi:hypothetical protein